MIKDKLRTVVEQALKRAITAGNPGVSESLPVVIGKTGCAENGDLTCGIALKLAARLHKSPINLAEEIASAIDVSPNYVCHITVAAPGFINFYLGHGWLQEALQEILQAGPAFGKSNIGASRKVLIEYVSANPAGNLGIEQGRGAVYSSCLSNLLSFTGHQVEQHLHITDSRELLSKLRIDLDLGHCGSPLHQSGALEEDLSSYDHLITVQVAGNQSPVPGWKSAFPESYTPELEVISTQTVHLQRDGQFFRMSDSLGAEVTLAAVLDEVGVDAVRYFLCASNPNNAINFDLELAKQSSRKNSSFYIQYAHARCCAILRNALEPALNIESGIEKAPAISQDQWQDYMDSYRSSAATFTPLFASTLNVLVHLKALVMHLQDLPAEVEEAALLRNPGRLAHYACQVATNLQRFHESCQQLSTSQDVSKAKLGLIVATRQVLANVLGIIGMAAPEKM